MAVNKNIECCQVERAFKELLNMLQPFEKGKKKKNVLSWTSASSISPLVFLISTPNSIGRFSVTVSFVKPILTTPREERNSYTGEN